MDVRRRSGRKGRQRLRRIWAVLAAIAVAMPTVAALATPVAAQAQYLEVRKTAQPYELEPGQTFTYSIQVQCSEQSCLDARLTDVLPAELAGFALVDVTTNPGEGVVPRTVTWTEAGQELPRRPDVVGPETGLTVDFTDDVTTPEGVGLQNGRTFTVQLSLRVPDDIAPGEHEIVNTARTTASNSLSDEASAPVRISVPEVVDVAATKGWEPAAQTFDPGHASTIALGVTNTSNVVVDVLTLQEPADAPDGAADLAPANPFTVHDLTGLGDATLPAGAQVQVDAYVRGSDGTWRWVSGTPQATPTLPDGVHSADVAGLRLTYTGDITPGDGAAVDVRLAQRDTHRVTGTDLSTRTTRVDNVVVATATSRELDRSASTEARAHHTVRPATVAVTTVKNIEPNTLTGGQSATGTLTATNSASPVAELRLADLDFFTTDITFGGFTEAPTWPAGATAGAVVFHPLDGGAAVTVPFAAGEVPAAPDTLISGFELVFTADGNAIEEAASTTALFRIDTTEDAAGEAAEATVTNTVTTTATAANGTAASDSDSDRLTVVTPAVGVTLDKQVRPTTSVQPGESVFVSLHARGTATDRATLHDVVVEDVIGAGDAEFWDAFDLVALAPTQVPADTVLTVEVHDATRGWVELTTHGPEGVATVLELDRQTFAAATSSAGATDITGARFSFRSGAGLPNDITLTPVLVLDARSELRSGGPVDTPEGEDAAQRPTAYRNSATTDVTGTSAAGSELTDDDGDTDTARVVTHPGGTGALRIAKEWDKDLVSAQAAATASTALRWSVTPGFATVTVTDPATDAGAPSGTVFEAFDLLRVRPIAGSSTPLSNGWHLRYDDITTLELHVAGSWVTVPAPAGGWVQDGRFVGYQLTPEQSAAATGVRLTLTEDTAAREAARQPGAAFDPYAPAPGSGVAAGSASRRFDLDWQLRERTRTDDGSTGAWVTDQVVYNVAGSPGTVDNTVALDGTRADGSTARDTDADAIQVVNPGPAVTVAKTVTTDQPVYVPEPDTPAAERPAATWTLTARNASVAAAGHVRVTDPAVACLAPAPLAGCQTDAPDADPFTGTDVDWLAHNPFRYVDLTAIRLAAGIPDQVDLDATVVWLLHHDGAGYRTSEHTGAQAVALDAAALADVVGVSVTFQAHDAGAAGAGSTITQANELRVTLESRLRATVRGTDEPLTLDVAETLDVDNLAFAQSYDDVLSPTVPTGDIAAARAVLTGGDVNIAPAKSVSPSEVLVTAPDVPVTVTLAADQGSNPRSTLSPSRVVLEDHAGSADFWDRFDLTGLGAVTLPDGADRVRVDVHGPWGADGEPAWVEGTPAATAQLPVPESSYGEVQGIRFVFTRSDGGYFDPTPPPAAGWSARAQFTVQLRETYRASGEDMVFAGSVDNTVTAQSFRNDGKDSAPVTATAQVTLSEGTRELEVNKLTNEGNRLANPGENVPFRISFTNAGTGFLTITELRDTLPTELVHLGEPEPVYTADEDGLLSEDVTLRVDGADLVLTWPEGGNRMAPGETFVVDLALELQPARDRVFNDVVVTTAEPLDRCGNVDGSTNWGQPGGDTSCATRDYVDAVAGPNLFAVKGVQGSLEGTAAGGAYHPGTGAVCTPTLEATGGSYYRSPCLAHSQLGGEDHWVLRVQNAGTSPVTWMTVFDQLPVDGDGFLVSGAARGSTYRPQFVGESLAVHAPDGTEVVVETTTSPDVCRGTWAGLTGSTPHTPCEQSGEVWTVVGDGTDWAAVTGLRVSLDFAGTATGALGTGDLVDVTFRTRNVVATDDDPSGAPGVVPAADSVAWNQFGVQYTDVDQRGQETVKRLAPNTVGVHLRTGSIGVAKEVTGPAADAYAPDAFDVEVACRVGDTALDLGDAATVTLSPDNDYRVRIDGIPYSADPQTACTVTEAGQSGAFGETSRTVDPVGGLLTLVEPTDPAVTTDEDSVPAPGSDVQVGDTVEYTVTVTQEGPVGIEDASLVDDLSAVLDDASYNDDAAASSGEVAIEDGVLSWSGDLALGEVVTITYSVTVTGGGDGTLANVVTSDDPRGGCVEEGGCVTTHDYGWYVFAKESAPGSGTQVEIGDTVEYMVTVTQEGPGMVEGASLVDDLSAVLDDASYNDDVTASAGEVSVEDGVLRWSGDLEVGQVVTISYSVTVTGGGDGTLANVVTSDDPRGECVEEDGCVTTHDYGWFTYAKDSDPAPGSDLQAGQTVTYTLTVTQHGPTGIEGVSITDDLSDVLDDATYNDDAATSSGEVVVEDGVLTWSGDLALDEVVTITYSVVFSGGGDEVLRNVVTSEDPRGECADLCVVQHPGGWFTYAKAADPAPGTDVPAGTTVEYTLTVTQRGEGAVEGASVTDDLSAVLDDATYNGDATASAGEVAVADGVLTWAGDLPVGEVVTITYSVTVTGDGDGTLRNAVTSDHPRGECDAVCQTEHPVPPAPTPPASGTGGSLPQTGVSAGGPAAVAASLLLLGAVLVTAPLRRRVDAGR